MAQSWAGKIKSAFEGVVDGADARARLASTAPLASFRLQLADRRLDAELAYIDEPWRVPFALAPVAAPLWLAEALVTLAQSFGDAESEAHPDRPTVMAALTHGQMLVLLEPVDVLLGDISGVLADPNRRPAPRLPQTAAPFAHTGAGLLTERVPVSYARGLLAGAASLAGATQVLMDDYSTFLQHASTPKWLTAGFATMSGDLAATQTRLDAVQLRAAPVLRQQPPDERALRTLVMDLWDLTNAYLKIGQLINAPGLLPGAQPLSRGGAPETRAETVSKPAGMTPAAAPPNPIRTPAAPPPKQPEPIASIPEIGGAATAAAHPTSAAVRMPDIGGTHLSPTAPASAAVRMPDIGGASSPGMPTAAADHPRAMPRIGGRPDAAAGSASTDVPPDPTLAAATPPAAPARRVERKDRWLLGSQATRYRLRAAGQEDQAEGRLAAFWNGKHWSLTAIEARYLDQTDQFVKSGAIALSGRSLAEPPFAPIYRVGNASLKVLDRSLRPGTLFSFDFSAGGQGLMSDLPAQTGIQEAL